MIICFFFLKDKCGYIGLVDLEESSLRLEKNSAQIPFIAKTALTIFPFHFKQIKEVIERFFETSLPPVFEEIATQISTLFFMVYANHKTYLESKVNADTALPNLSTLIGKEISKQINDNKMTHPLHLPITISDTLKRTLQISVEELCLSIKEECLDSLKEELLFLKTNHFIQYFNFYSNRAKKLCLIIHF